MKIGIIGFGDLGRSLISGLIKGGINKEDVLVYDVADRRTGKAGNMGLNVCEDADTLVKQSRRVIFAIPKKSF
ncbi:MAG: NAD(P)-binding domain-containing protein [Oscillospiraceae bacterium]|nr:NAD(P)-binding domain-containing protein [Oscillospiraceae bacterium]